MNLLHIYPQLMEHCEAKILGNRSALKLLRDAIDRALENGVSAVAGEGGEHKNPDGSLVSMRSGEVEDQVIFARDGEGYQVDVCVMPDDWNDDKWKSEESEPYYSVYQHQEIGI